MFSLFPHSTSVKESINLNPFLSSQAKQPIFLSWDSSRLAHGLFYLLCKWQKLGSTLGAALMMNTNSIHEPEPTLGPALERTNPRIGPGPTLRIPTLFRNRHFVWKGSCFWSVSCGEVSSHHCQWNKWPGEQIVVSNIIKTTIEGTILRFIFNDKNKKRFWWVERLFFSWPFMTTGKLLWRIGKPKLIKGTVAWDFWPLVFFMNQ